MFNEVLESRFETLLASVRQAKTFDQLIVDHTDFLDTCLKECLLTNKTLLEVSCKKINYLSCILIGYAAE